MRASSLTHLLVVATACGANSRGGALHEPASTVPVTPALASSHPMPAPSAVPATAEPAARLSLEEALCGTHAGCRVDSAEPLPVPSSAGRPHLVRTSLTPEAAAAADWGGMTPDYYIVLLDGAGKVVRFQRLASGFREGKEPTQGELPSTFSLEFLPVKGGAYEGRLDVSEPSPGGTAWGRTGFVRFSWPAYDPIEWEHHAYHAINPLLNSLVRWNWETRSGESDYGRFAFRYVVPRLALDPAFTADAWQSAEFTGCASRLHAGNGEHLPGDRASPHALTAVLSASGELFVELHIAAATPLSERASLEVCFAADVLRSEPERPGMRPQCSKISLDERSTSTRVDRAPDRPRYRFRFTPAELGDLPAVTLILRDPARRQSLVSSQYDPKTHLRLGDVLTFAPARVTCKLDGGALSPRFGPPDPNRTLIEQLAW